MNVGARALARISVRRLQSACLGRLLVGCTPVLVAALALGQGQSFLFKDRDGKMTISNMGSWRATLDKNDPDLIHFRGRALAGELEGVWDVQKLRVRAKAIEGTARKGAGPSQLEQAILTGGVTSTITRPSSIKGGGNQTVVVNSDRMDFDGNSNRMDLTGGVKVNQDDPAAKSTMTATGAKATVVLTDAQGQGAKDRPIESADLTGSAKIVFTSERTVTQREKSGPVKKRVEFTMTATASRVDFKVLKGGKDYGTVTLTGSVVVTGNDPILFGEMKGYERIVITLDSEMQPVDIEAGEGRGTTTVTQKKGGGTH